LPSSLFANKTPGRGTYGIVKRRRIVALFSTAAPLYRLADRHHCPGPLGEVLHEQVMALLRILEFWLVRADFSLTADRIMDRMRDLHSSFAGTATSA
jgi:hypothetical protein